MPIYEYRCSACGFEREYLQKLADAPIVVCESCGQSTMSKLVSAAGFQLKGSGWYVTDFKNSGGKAKATETDKKEQKEPAAKDSQSGSAASSDADSKPSAAENKEKSKPSAGTDSKGSGADTKSAAEPAAR
jgi:putative FmdB family regulatory protein